jgi:hypothetical protein
MKLDKTFKPVGVWKIYPDSKATHLMPTRWWHKFMFWRKYSEWVIAREYKTLTEIMDEAGGQNETI